MNPLPVSHLFDFSRKVILVTGSTGGIGRGIALRFAQAGADVMLHYNQNSAAAATLAEEIQKIGRKAFTMQADVSDSGQVSDLMHETRYRLGQLDILINNAGIYPSASLLTMTETHWDETINANLRNVFLCTQAAANIMLEQENGGNIINIASIEAFFPAPSHSHYNASKAGVVMFTRSASRELAPYRIRVNAVSPGLIWREGIEQNWPEGVSAWKRSTPLKRLGYPEDIADACLFLASPASRWITGINLVVDGGASTTPAFQV